MMQTAEPETGSQQPPLWFRADYLQSLVTKLELVKFQLHVFLYE